MVFLCLSPLLSHMDGKDEALLVWMEFGWWLWCLNYRNFWYTRVCGLSNWLGFDKFRITVQVGGVFRFRYCFNWYVHYYAALVTPLSTWLVCPLLCSSCNSIEYLLLAFIIDNWVWKKKRKKKRETVSWLQVLVVLPPCTGAGSVMSKQMQCVFLVVCWLACFWHWYCFCEVDFVLESYDLWYIGLLCSFDVDVAQFIILRRGYSTILTDMMWYQEVRFKVCNSCMDCQFGRRWL